MQGRDPGVDTLAALRRGDLAGVRELRLPGLTAFPREILALADTLEVLDIGGGTLSALPDDFGRLHRLRVLFASGNRFACLPPALGDCPALSQVGFRATGLREVPTEALPPALRWLTLTDNRIEHLPDALGARPALQKLMLAGNRLRALPESLAGATHLELVRLSANRFEAMPAWLPALPRLAWASWAGNPCEPEPATTAAPAVRWLDLQLGPPLGEGASGEVFAARWCTSSGERPVALKLFKGAMTSDGLPEREMAACLAAGEHPHLPSSLGQLVDHPGGRAGLVMPLLPTGWGPLAGPPSFASCTRDVYDPALRLAPEVAIRIARGIASAVAHLHARGLMHGDLYAHNVLWDGTDGAAVLSDFGAACVLPAGAQGEAWQRVEVRAFGILLLELLARTEAAFPGCEGLRTLAKACTAPSAEARPLMAEIVATLWAYI